MGASSAASGLGCGDCEVNDSALWHEAYSMRVCDGCWKRWWSFQVKKTPGAKTKYSIPPVRNSRRRIIRQIKKEMIDPRVLWKKNVFKQQPQQAAPRHPHVIWMTLGEAVLAHAGWARLESRSKPGVFYYYCSLTGKSVAETEEPPRCPQTQQSQQQQKQNHQPQQQEQQQQQKKRKPKQKQPPQNTRTATQTQQQSSFAPSKWMRVESRSSPGTFYFYSPLTGESRLECPDS